MTSKRYHEVKYDATTGLERAYHYTEWRKLMDGKPVVTEPHPSPSPKRRTRG
jgi:hypothetical protein